MPRSTSAGCCARSRRCGISETDSFDRIFDRIVNVTIVLSMRRQTDLKAGFSLGTRAAAERITSSSSRLGVHHHHHHLANRSANSARCRVSKIRRANRWRHAAEMGHHATVREWREGSHHCERVARGQSPLRESGERAVTTAREWREGTAHQPSRSALLIHTDSHDLPDHSPHLLVSTRSCVPEV